MIIPMNSFTSYISKNTGLDLHAVDATLELLQAGCTIPFIARYRKEATGGLNEVQIAQISELNGRLTTLGKRKETILKTIEEQGKLTPELKAKIEASWDQTEIEDLYLPYKPRRRTKAQIARELGLEPLANLLMFQRDPAPLQAARRFVKEGVDNVEAALQGARDIIAERVSEDQHARQSARAVYQRDAVISSRVVKKKEEEEGAQKYSDYFCFSEELRKCSSHRLLAMRRGEAEGFLRVTISADDDEIARRLHRQFVRGQGPCQQQVAMAVDDGYERLLRPSMENEFAALSKERADEEAIRVFRENLRQLLLAAPLGQKRVLGVDPGIRTGCKVVALDAQGNLLYHTVIFAVGDRAKDNGGSRPTALQQFSDLCRKFGIEAIAVGNGTGSRETADILRQIPGVPTYVVSEDGASIYSASETAREEFPDEDITVRGAVSIGRRLMDPLAELVKIDPKSIGVGQYQHDVDQQALKHSLDQTVELCVNSVGVNLNTASKHLLTYVSGLGPQLAQNIVDYRREHGAFASRAELRKVPRLGPVAFQQCAGFLRIPGARNPLDASAVHPERYKLVEQMARDNGCTVTDLMNDPQARKRIDIQRYVTKEVGLPTLRDIMQELEKPGRDPRAQIETFEFDPRVHTVDDLVPGMELPGIVTNITNFGAFVDIGVHQDGLVHISQIADRFVRDINSVIHLHQQVRVRVLEVDHRRHRISLTMRKAKKDRS